MRRSRRKQKKKFQALRPIESLLASVCLLRLATPARLLRRRGTPLPSPCARRPVSGPRCSRPCFCHLFPFFGGLATHVAPRLARAVGPFDESADLGYCRFVAKLQAGQGSCALAREELQVMRVRQKAARPLVHFLQKNLASWARGSAFGCRVSIPLSWVVSSERAQSRFAELTHCWALLHSPLHFPLAEEIARARSRWPLWVRHNDLPELASPRRRDDRSHQDIAGNHPVAVTPPTSI